MRFYQQFSQELLQILAKHGLQNVHADVRLGVRTAVIFFLVMVLNVIDSKYKQLPTLTAGQVNGVDPIGRHNTLSWDFLLPGREGRPRIVRCSN